MIKINLSPQRRDDTLVITKNGNKLTINGDELDLTDIPDGATYNNAEELHPFLVGDITRTGSSYELTVLLPHGANPETSQAWPEPIVNPPNGTVDLPSNTYSETIIEEVEGGTDHITTTYRWHQDPEVVTIFVASTEKE